MEESKWNAKYARDLAERVASTALGGVLAVITASATGVVSTDPQVWWVMVGVPSAVSLLKGLLVNLGDTPATASLVGITSNKN